MATDLSEYRGLYFKTAKEYLEKLMSGVVSFSSGESSAEIIHSMHVSAHSLKSQSQLIGFHTVAQVAGAMEDILREVKEGKRLVSPEVIAFCKQATDSLLVTISQLESMSTVPATGEAHDSVSSLPTAGTGKTIILIEDDLFLRQFYATKLKESNFTIETASDGDEGMKKIKEKRPDVILLDLIMPKKDGFSVLKDLSEDQSLKTIPVIVFSTLGQEKDIEKAKSLGARDYMDKSFFNFEGLLSKVNEYIPK